MSDACTVCGGTDNLTGCPTCGSSVHERHLTFSDDPMQAPTCGSEADQATAREKGNR